MLIAPVCTALLVLAMAGCSELRIPEDTETLQSFGKGRHGKLPETLTVLVWNLYKGQLTGWQDDLLRLGEQADLLLLQEATTSDAMMRTLGALPGVQWDLATSFEYAASGHGTGVLTGSRATPSAVEYVRSEGREPLVQTPKMALLTLHALNPHPQPLLVVNVHGHLAVSEEAFSEQMQQIARRAAGHRGPMLWAGDFNTWSDARYRFVGELADRLGLQEVTVVPEGRTSWFGNVIDRAFVRGVDVQSARALPEVESSDHVPFILELKVSATHNDPYVRRGPARTAASAVAVKATPDRTGNGGGPPGSFPPGSWPGRAAQGPGPMHAEEITSGGVESRDSPAL